MSPYGELGQTVPDFWWMFVKWIASSSDYHSFHRKTGCQHVRHHMLGKAGDLLLGTVGIMRSREWLTKGVSLLILEPFAISGRLYSNHIVMSSQLFVLLLIALYKAIIWPALSKHASAFLAKGLQGAIAPWKIQGILPLCCAQWTKTIQGCPSSIQQKWQPLSCFLLPSSKC